MEAEYSEYVEVFDVYLFSRYCDHEKRWTIKAGRFGGILKKTTHQYVPHNKNLLIFLNFFFLFKEGDKQWEIHDIPHFQIIRRDPVSFTMVVSHSSYTGTFRPS